MNKIVAKSFLLGLICFLSSCGMGTPDKYTDTPTAGSISISVDETFKPIIDSELLVFHALYKNAHINVHYVPESQCFKDLMNDSVRLVITTRKLVPSELDYFHQLKYFPTETSLAKDGIAIIVNNKNQDTLFTYQQIKDIMTGKITSWKQIHNNSPLQNIQIVFDHAGSSTVRYMKDSVMHTNELPSNVFATKTNQEVIQYVMGNPNAIGIIGVNWCKSVSDSSTLDFSNKIKVAGIQPAHSGTSEVDFPPPYQSYISLGYYPFSRTIYSISREARSGLGTGFVAFLASDRGQRIILKSGLVPATMPIRILSFNKNKKA
jgi:phosphate transport system substrate-binding protein